MKGSLAAKIWNESEGDLPAVPLEEAKTLYAKLRAALEAGLVLSCHDLSEGGLAVAAAEMAFGNEYGLSLEVPADGEAAFLFSETPSRFLIEVAREKKDAVEKIFGSGAQPVGQTVKKPLFVVQQREAKLLQEPVKKLKELWQKPLGSL